MSSKALAIKDGLVEIIAAIQLDGQAAFTEVKGHPRGQFDGFPSVRVLPGDQLTQKESFSENERTVAFTVRTHLPATNDGSEFDHMYKLTDLIIDTLDSADFYGQLDAALPDVGAWILNATRADWFDEDSQEGPILSCDLEVQVKYSKDNE